MVLPPSTSQKPGSRPGTDSKRKALIWGSAQNALDRALAKVQKGERVIDVFGSGTSAIGDVGAGLLAEVLATQTASGALGLVSLHVRGNKIGDAGAVHLAEALEHGHAAKLRKLDFSGNEIGDRGAVRLSQALHLGSELQLLRLQDNSIGDEGATHLAQEVLEQHPALEELQLGGNQLGEAGAASFVRVLGRHPSLRVLVLDKNAPLGDAGVVRLADALGKRSALQALHAAGTGAGDTGALHLAEALKRHAGLRELHLSDNAVGDKGASALATSVEYHDGLRMLSLQNNRVRDETALTFVEVLARMAREDIVVNLRGNPVQWIRFSDASLANLTVAAQTAKSVSRRGIRLKHLLKIYKEFVGSGRISEEVTTGQMVEEVVKPETRSYAVSFAEFFHTPPAEVYVIHPWRGLFRDLVRAVAAHATGITEPQQLDPDHVQFLQHPEALERSYFIDVFATDQNAVFPVGDPRCQSDKFDLVVSALRRRGSEALLVVDTEHLPLTRLWCLSEGHRVLRDGLPLSVSFGTLRPMLRSRRVARLQDAEVSSEADGRFLREELDSTRSVGRGEEFDTAVTDELRQRILARYNEIFATLGAEQQQALEWEEEYDNAVEDLRETTAGTDIFALQRAIDAAYDCRVRAKTMQPALQRRAELALSIATEGEDIQALLRALEEGTLKLPAEHFEGQLTFIATTLPGKRQPSDEDLEDDAADGAGEGAEGGLGEEEGLKLPNHISKRGEEAQDEPAGEESRESTAAEGVAGDTEEVERVAARPQFGCHSVEMALQQASEALEQVIVLAEEERLEAEAVEPARKILKIVQGELRRRTALAEMVAVAKLEDSEALRQAMQEALEAGVDDESLAKADVRLKELELSDAVRGFDSKVLRSAIEAATKAGIAERAVEVGKARLREIDPFVYRQLIHAELVAAMAGSDIEILQRALQAAQEADVDGGIIKSGRAQLAELQVAAAMKSGCVGDLHRAIEAAKSAGVKWVVEAARRRLFELEMVTAAEGTDRKVLREAIDAAAAADVGAEPMAAARRRLAELEVLATVDDGAAKESVQQALAAAEGLGVEEQVLKPARKRLAEMELEGLMDSTDMQQLGDAIRVGRRVSASEATLTPATRRLTMLELMDLTGYCERDDVLRQAICEAEEIGVEESVLETARRRLVLLELRVAAKGEDVDALLLAIAAAKEREIDQSEVRPAKRRLADLDADAHESLLSSELSLAAQGSDTEVLQRAIEDAREAGVSEDEVVSGKTRLAELLLAATSQLEVACADDGGLEAGIESAQRSLDLAEEVSFGEEQAVEAARAKLEELRAEVARRRAKEALVASLQTQDLQAIQDALRNAEQAGVEGSLLAEAREML